MQIELILRSIDTGLLSETGPILTSHPERFKLIFTGSTEECAGTLKKTPMELSSHAPFIVFDNTDLDAAIDGLMVSKYRNSAQTCVCTNRVKEC